MWEEREPCAYLGKEHAGRGTSQCKGPEGAWPSGNRMDEWGAMGGWEQRGFEGHSKTWAFIQSDMGAIKGSKQESGMI